MHAVLLWLCWQESPGGQERERAQGQGQVQRLALVVEQEYSLWWGQQQVWICYFQQAEACPGW